MGAVRRPGAAVALLHADERRSAPVRHRRVGGGMMREFDPVPHVHGWFPDLPPTPCAAGAGALTNERIPLPLSIRSRGANFRRRDTRDFVATPRLPVALRLLTFLLVGCGGAPFTVSEPTIPEEGDVVRLEVAMDDAGVTMDADARADAAEVGPAPTSCSSATCAGCCDSTGACQPAGSCPAPPPPQPVTVRCIVLGVTYACSGAGTSVTLDGMTGQLLVGYAFDGGVSAECPTTSGALPTTPCVTGTVCFVEVVQGDQVGAVERGSCE
jgi:hypothetical protein